MRQAHNKLSHREFTTLLKKIHPQYKLLEEYTGALKTECFCVLHKKEFMLNKVNHVFSRQGDGCSKCKTLNKRKSMSTTLKQKDFENRIMNLFPQHKVIGNYINCNTPVKAFCKTHKLNFDILPNNALYNKYPQCPGCRGNAWTKKRSCRTSSVSQKWIRLVCKHKRWKHSLVKCSDNGDEFYIHGIGFVDGYHPPTNTVLEFHGDYWHGNPKLYRPEYETFTGKKAKDLYKRTKKREAAILKAGFSLIVMWEYDFRLLGVDV